MPLSPHHVRIHCLAFRDEETSGWFSAIFTLGFSLHVFVALSSHFYPRVAYKRNMTGTGTALLKRPFSRRLTLAAGDLTIGFIQCFWWQVRCQHILAGSQQSTLACFSSKNIRKYLCYKYVSDNIYTLVGCEGDLAVPSVTPLTTRVDSADLAG